MDGIDKLQNLKLQCVLYKNSN